MSWKDNYRKYKPLEQLHPRKELGVLGRPSTFSNIACERLRMSATGRSSSFSDIDYEVFATGGIKTRQ